MAISFGPDWQREIAASPYRLRFELSEGGTYVNMFTTAFDRARQLARAALPSEQIVAVIAGSAYRSSENGEKLPGQTPRSAFDVLKEMGVPSAPSQASWLGHTHPGDEDDPEARPCEHRAVSVTWAQADILLWNQIAHDLKVTPQSPVLSRLVDIERGVTVYAYDDRGMDVAALSPGPIAELHARFEEWLLE